MKANWILSVLFIGIVIVSSGVGVSEVLKEHAFLSKAELDDGTITDYQVDSSGKSVEFCPIIDFKTKAGEPQEYEGADCQNHPQDVIIGQHVQVWFDPQEPDRFQTFRGSVFAAYLDVSFPFFFGILFLLIAALMIAISLGTMVSARRRQAAYRPISPTPNAYPSGLPSFGGSEASLEAQAASLKAQTERLQAQEEELQRKIEARRGQQGQ